MTIVKKIWLITIFLMIGTNITIYFTISSLQLQVSLYLLSLTIALPVWLACKKLKELLMKEEEWTIHQEKLIKQIIQLEEKNSQLNQFIQGMATPVFSFDVTENKWFVSKNMVDILGLTDQDQPLTMEDLEGKIHLEDKQKFLKDKESWFSGTPTTSDYRIVGEDDQNLWIEIRTNVDVDSSGDVNRIYGIVIDVTKQKAKKEKLVQMAFYDPLTNLPNRIMLKSHLKKVISRAKRKEHDVTIMFLDLDGFKNINDSLGHDTGDALLKEVANRLDESVREEDLISRLGGDEFIIVVEETTKEEVTMIADRVLNNISLPYSILNNTASITPSIGISTYPDDGLDIESLIKNADKAMYLAKDQGKANYQFYTKDLEDYQPKESLIDKVLKLFQK